MTEQPEWVHFSKIDWDCENFNQFNIDTRDFHVGYRFEDKPHKDMATFKKYPEFFHTKDELVSLIQRYFDESGGDGEWRYFSLKGNNNDVSGWDLKYLRIWRTDLGFVICNSNHRALRKSILALPVNLEHLSKH